MRAKPNFRLYLINLCALCILGSISLFSVADSSPASQTQTRAQMSVFFDQLAIASEQIDSTLIAVDMQPVEEWTEKSLIELAEQELSLAEEQQDGTEGYWQDVLDNERLSLERIAGTQRRLEELQDYEAHFSDWRLRLNQLSDLPVETTGDELSLSEIETTLIELRERQQLLLLELEQKRSTLQRLEEQMGSRGESLQELLQASTTLADKVDTSPNPRLATALDTLQQSEMRRQEARILTARIDQILLQPRALLLRLEVEANELETLLIAQGLQWLESELSLRSTQELRDLNSSLTQLLERQPEILEQFSDEVQQMRVRLDSIAERYERVRELQQQRVDYERWINELNHSLSTVNERLSIGGLSEAIGVQFLDEQKRLETYGNPEMTLQSLERELTQSRLRSINLRDDLRRVHQLPELSASVVDLNELVRIASNLLNIQIQAEQQLIEQLRQNEYRLRQVDEISGRLDLLLKETLLWWPSHSPTSLTWLNHFQNALPAMLDRRVWQGMLTNIFSSLGESKMIGTLLVLLVLGLYVWARRSDQQLEIIAEQTSHKYTDNISLTFKAIGWSLLRVLPIPMLLSGFAYLFLQGDLSPGVDILSDVMLATAGWWLAGHLFLIFTSKHGVGSTHFDWNPLILRRVRRDLIWFMPSQLGLIIFVALTYAHPEELVYDVFGRLGLALISILNLLITWRILAPAPHDTRPFFHSNKRRWLRFGFALLSFAMLVLTMAGYLLTVSELLPRVVDTLVVFSMILLIYSIAVRALVLSETRLRIRRKKEQRARQALEEGNAEGEGAIELPEPHLSIEDIGQQTQTLLKTSLFLGLLFALFMVWVEVMPALNWLDNVTLWSRTIVLGDSEITSRVSLQSLLLALLLGFFFIIANKNLPGLIEIILSRSKLVDQVHSYTVTTLVRYAISIVAVITIFSLLGLRWSELQWMVAALTLGLGFGLQEVVANFVSGLIMLFERPVRVGDTITIGEYSGTVARIRTRATTIIDWDNREIVDPNKNFITERLINWTLSDNTTRVVIPVGVSYEADPEEVMAILMDIATQHPLALKDPAPNVYFLNFADSALSFELRVYVNQMNDRLVVISELHVQILRAFRKANIEIAFPQMDLHIRDLPDDKHVQVNRSHA